MEEWTWWTKMATVQRIVISFQSILAPVYIKRWKPEEESHIQREIGASYLATFRQNRTLKTEHRQSNIWRPWSIQHYTCKNTTIKAYYYSLFSLCFSLVLSRRHPSSLCKGNRSHFWLSTRAVKTTARPASMQRRTMKPDQSPAAPTCTPAPAAPPILPTYCANNAVAKANPNTNSRLEPSSTTTQLEEMLCGAGMGLESYSGH